MRKIAIVTDSTACIPSEFIHNLPVFILPVYVIWGNKTYKDGIDIFPDEFYTRLKNEPESPRTSQISIQEFVNCYRSLIDQGYEILSIHVSGRVSGTVNAALQAVRELASDRIAVFDSMTSAAAQAFQVLAAARSAVQGATIRECLAIVEKIRAHSHTYFIPGSLEYLRRGGRIGGAAAFIGSMLKIHPILEARNGVIEAVERVRTLSRAMQRAAQLVEQLVDNSKHIRLAGLYADIPILGQQLLDLTTARLGIQRIKHTFTSTISPALGVHIGPGSVGIAVNYCEDPSCVHL